MARLIFTLLPISLVLADPSSLFARDDCTTCNPSGQTTTTPPAVGAGLEPLYTNLVNSVQGIHWKREDNKNLGRRDEAPLCCAPTTSCVLVQGIGIAMCYDKFTTNFIFPDGSSGNINSGSYNAKSGQAVNLITGDVSGGANIYAADPAAKPNTATMAIPPLYTATGVGGAIPVASLTGYLIVTTVVGPTTVPAMTVRGTIVSQRTVSGEVIPGTTILATTLAATTVGPGQTAAITEPSAPSAGSQTGDVAGMNVQLATLLVAAMLGVVAVLL